MTDQQGVVRRISWRDLFPWLIIFRSFRIAISPLLLALATAAVIVTPVGWALAQFVFQPPRTSASAGIADDLPARASAAIDGTRAERWQREIPRSENSQLRRYMPPVVDWLLPDLETAFLESYFDLSEPLKRFFQLQLTLRETAYYAFGTLWTLAIWAFVGGVATRRAVVQLATESPPGVRESLEFAARRYHWYLLAPLYPLLGVVLLVLPIALLGLPVRFAPGLGSILAGLLWVLVALAGLAAAWLFGGLIFGWPLMWPTVSAERDGDPFEAFSRSYSYVYGKPLHLLFYVLVAALLGALGWAVVQVAAALVREFGFWALSWGGGDEQVTQIRAQSLAFAEGVRVSNPGNRSLTIGTSLIGLVVALIHAVATAFRYTYFFAAASAIYLLLRQDVDEKEMDEVYLEPPAPLEETPEPAPAATATSSVGAPPEEGQTTVSTHSAPPATNPPADTSASGNAPHADAQNDEPPPADTQES